jgi:hypothetical protein
MLTFQRYKAIRILIESGEADDVIAKTFGCKKETVLLIKRCKTYDDYKHEMSVIKARVKAENQKKKNQDAAPAPAASTGMNIGQIKIEATHYMMEELKRNNELLTLISNKLTAIMEELGVMNK